MTKSIKKPSLLASLTPIVILVILLSLNVILWGDATLDGSNQTALLMAAAIAAIIGVRLGNKWLDMRAQIVKTIGTAMPSILILLLIGALAGTWMLSGVVPALIYYGLDILHPSIFLIATLIICALVSLATGSSWSTVATIGVALLGIGNAMGFNNGVIAGAIISGAYFGDKISPMSDTTNLAPAMAGTDLFTHIRYMLYTTVPTLTITFIIFLILGFTFDHSSSSQNITEVQKAITDTFYISPILFVVPVFLIFIILKKVAPLPSLAAGSLLGAIFAIIFQPDVIEQIAGYSNNYLKASYTTVMQAVYGSNAIETPNKAVSDLFETTGMAGMLNTIWLILSAMVFGGIMQSAGMLAKITESIMKLVRSDRSLVASTAFSCIFFNFTASDQYLSIVVPGKMYSSAYRNRNLKPEVLSRTLEDSGTVTSALIPWNTCGATQSRVLGVSVIEYLPYAFFNLISPIMTIMVAWLNIKIRRYKEGEEKPVID
jgi:Na+:H+ antiporter, NhaC family